MMTELHAAFRGTLRDLTWSEPATTAAPDDCDLAAMARLALNYLRRSPDPVRNYECKFSLGPLGIPAHVPLSPPNAYGFDPISLGDTDCRMEWQYAHMRAMTGEDAEAVEQAVYRRVLGYLRDDNLAWINPAAYIGEDIEGEWVGTWTTAKLLYTLSEAYARTGDDGAKTRARAIFTALRALAQWNGDRAYYPGIAPYRDGEWLMRGWCQTHGRNYPFIVEPVVRYWECTGDTEALNFARAVAEGFLAGVQQPEQGPLKIDPETGAFADHVHLHTHAAWGVAHLGAVLGEARFLDWAERVYRFVLAQGTDFGWFPEFIPQGEYRTEICVVGDMVSLAAWLARGGKPEYWDHVDRAVRNTLRRSQFTLTPAFLELFHRVHAEKDAATVAAAVEELRALEGAFVAQASFDDWVSYPGTLGQPGLYANGIHMMGCCPPEGMRALWEAWCGTVAETAEGVFVNLPFSREHPAAMVTAAPSSGCLRVQARTAGRFFLRPPAWAPRDAVRVTRNGLPASVQWGGPAERYVALTVQIGDEVVLTHPVPSLTQTCVPTSVPGRADPLTVRWRGNTVLGVEPRGQYLPMFTDSCVG
jgi:hypothetical protein